MSRAPDAHSPGNPQYDRDEVIAAMTDFYQFLAELPYIDPSAILFPPESGWPNITWENFGGLNMNNDVIELLRRLPYIDMATSSGHEYVVAPATHPCDYRNPRFETRPTKEAMAWHIPDGDEFPEWVVPLTYGRAYGTYLMLDTSDGTVAVYGNGEQEETSDYRPEDPRAWRNRCKPGTWQLPAFLEGWKDKYRRLEWIAFPQNDWPHVWCADDPSQIAELNELQRIFYSHGWPDAFRREECKRALLEWDAAWVNG